MKNHGSSISAVMTTGSRTGLLAIAALTFPPTAARATRPQPTDPPQSYQHTGKVDRQTLEYCTNQLEYVYYSHRIWPAQNPGTRPPFQMSNQQLTAFATDFLRKAGELQHTLGLPTAAQIQGEINRIVQQTQDPAMLIELYAAINNDPQLFAACIAEVALVNRLYLEAQASGALSGNGNNGNPQGQSGQSGQNGQSGQGNGQNSPQPVFVVPQISTENCAAWSPVRSGAPASRNVEAYVFTGSELIVWGAQQIPDDTGGRYNPALDDWLPTPTSSAPVKRYNASAVWTGTEMIVWGGHTGTGQYLNSGGRYNAANNSWIATSTGANVPAPRDQHTAIWTGNEMIIWGGFCYNASSSCKGPNTGRLGSGGRYNPATDAWAATSTGTNVPANRLLHTAVWTGSTDNPATADRMIVWGGESDDGLNSGAIYDPSAGVDDSWTPLPTLNAPTTRVAHSAVWAGSTDPYGNRFACFNAPSTCLNKMIVWGGISGINVTNNGGMYDPVTNAWQATDDVGANTPTRRQLHTAVWTGGEMIVWGGQGCEDASCSTNQFRLLGTGGRFNPTAGPNGTWVPVSTGTNVPAARNRFAAVWDNTRQQMIVWGGNAPGDGGETNTGGRYNLASNSWLPTYQGLNVPTKRSGHTAVWSGAEMVVWGGGSSNTGGKYYPVLNDWVATCDTNSSDRTTCINNTTNLPTHRNNHTAVWTGDRVLVWGGFDYSLEDPKEVNSGAKYSPGAWPSQGTWTSTISNTNNPPPNGCLPIDGVKSGIAEARTNHTAVWTGNHMMVWGGDVTDDIGNAYEIKSWGRYNNANDTNDFWECVKLPDSSSYLNNPSQRRSHTAVWTGAQMIEWGGLCDKTLNTGIDCPGGSGDLSSGGAYGPSSDSWIVTSAAAAPAPRSSHTAVWTGSNMLVWGGSGGGAPLPNGGAYSPTSGWSGLSSAGDPPPARYNHTAVWTGETGNQYSKNQMIVWGGQDGAVSFLDSGAQYLTESPGWRTVPVGGFSSEKRTGHTAVWTGINDPALCDDPVICNNKMIIWGGQDLTSGFLNSGASYNPLGISISSQPQPAFQNVCFGDPVSYSVTASSAATLPLMYQWRKDGNPITGATTSSHVFNAGCTDGGSYDVNITGACGDLASTGAVLRVGPTISQQPPEIYAFSQLDANGTQCSADILPHYYFSVTASCINTYQWQFCRTNPLYFVDCTNNNNWMDIHDNTGGDPTASNGYTGTTRSTLAIHFPSCFEEGYYRVAIYNNGCPRVQSSTLHFLARSDINNQRCCAYP